MASMMNELKCTEADDRDVGSMLHFSGYVVAEMDVYHKLAKNPPHKMLDSNSWFQYPKSKV
jgi:hypothetical protein